MSIGTDSLPAGLLHGRMRWVVSLRWSVAGLIVLFDAVQWMMGPLFEPAGVIALVGAALLAMNAIVAAIISRSGEAGCTTRRITRLAWAQFAADLFALTVILALTGGLGSPVIAFAVFPMIFASLFLSRTHAYAAAVAAVVLIAATLRLTGAWPETDAGRLAAVAWMLTLLFSVHLVNIVTQGLISREHTRAAQDRKLIEMRERLMQQERAMARVEKLVSMGQLAAGVAHEISNPLASMDGLLQLMQRHPDKPRPEAVAQLREQVARINATVRRMTSLGHPDLGTPEPVEIAGLIRETVEILRYDHRLREIEVELELADDLGTATTNPRAVQQALMNLLINAADALAGIDEPRIMVQARRIFGACRIDITDNGPGIPEADRVRIFDPFVTTKPPGLGTGLGLSISRDLIAEQGGILSLTNAPGRGATFTISIPIKNNTNSDISPF